MRRAVANVGKYYPCVVIAIAVAIIALAGTYLMLTNLA